MNRKAILGIVAVLGAALAMPATSSASATITLLDDNTFSPRNATLDLGAGSFDWEWGPGGVGTAAIHDVIQQRRLFDSGAAVRERPGGFSVTASAGGYPYYCSIHLGMTGKVGVRPVAGDRTSGGGVRVSWASSDTTTGNRFDVRYRAQRKWRLWRKSTRKQSGTFGRKGKPVRVKRKGVRLQVRSRARKKRSAWSPTLTLRP